MKKILMAVASLLFAACATAPVENLPLEGTQWKLTELHGESNPAFEAGDAFTFTLDAGTITGRGSVNRFFGGYEYSETGVLEVGDLGMTRMMGPNIDLENEFVRMFDEVDGCTIEGDVLTLTADGKAVAVFGAYTPDPDAEASLPAGGIRIVTVDEAQAVEGAEASEAE